MDRATEAAIKAVILGLHRSKAISRQQIDSMADELAFAASDIRASDATAAGEIEGLANWFRKAIASDADGKRGRFSRF